MSSVDPDRFIDYTGTPSIKWGLLFSTIIGSYLLASWEAATTFLIDLREGIADLLLGLAGGAAAIIANVFDIPIDAVAAAFVETASWLGLFGPLAFPIGVVATVVTIELTRRGISRVV